jgi:hypothetical protein
MAFQLFVMDEDGANVDKIGHINVAGALHPVILKDGRIIFSTFESQGMRNGYTFWGVWSIHPDGTNWTSALSSRRYEMNTRASTVAPAGCTSITMPHAVHFSGAGPPSAGTSC